MKEHYKSVSALAGDFLKEQSVGYVFTLASLTEELTTLPGVVIESQSEFGGAVSGFVSKQYALGAFTRIEEKTGTAKVHKKYTLTTPHVMIYHDRIGSGGRKGTLKKPYKHMPDNGEPLPYVQPNELPHAYPVGTFAAPATPLLTKSSAQAFGNITDMIHEYGARCAENALFDASTDDLLAELKRRSSR